jgi:hypothetical protein
MIRPEGQKITPVSAILTRQEADDMTRQRPALSGALALILAMLSLAAAPAPSQPASARVTALVGGRLIDGYGGRPLENSVVLISGERIQEVGRVGEVKIPDGAEVISTEGMSVLPGLWDMHVHLMIVGHADYGHWDKTYPKLFRGTIMPAAARQLLLAGVTSARDLGAPLTRPGARSTPGSTGSGSRPWTPSAPPPTGRRCS